MKRSFSLILTLVVLHFSLCFVFFNNNVLAQNNSKVNEITLTDGTPIKLRLNRTLSSADAKLGESVDFDVLEDVKVGDVIVIPRNTIAMGSVTRAKKRGRMGKSGKLDITIDSIRLFNDEKIPLRASKETEGKGSTGVMTGAIVASSILFFPAAPVFLLMKGKDITIPKGTEVTSYVAGDIPINLNKLLKSQSPTNTIVSTGTSDTDESSELDLQINSTPEGADIMINGKFVGNTPSTVRLKPGDHFIMIKKNGYNSWDRAITLTSGSEISIKAELEKAPK